MIIEAATTTTPRFRWQTSPGAGAFAGMSLADLDGGRVLAQTRPGCSRTDLLRAASRVLALCNMKTLYLRNVPDDVVERLERLAARDAMSVNAVAVRELAEASRRAENQRLLGLVARPRFRHGRGRRRPRCGARRKVIVLDASAALSALYNDGPARRAVGHRDHPGAPPDRLGDRQRNTSARARRSTGVRRRLAAGPDLESPGRHPIPSGGCFGPDLGTARQPFRLRRGLRRAGRSAGLRTADGRRQAGARAGVRCPVTVVR